MLCEKVKHNEIDGTVLVLKIVPKMQLNKRDTPGVGAMGFPSALYTHTQSNVDNPQYYSNVTKMFPTNCFSAVWLQCEGASFPCQVPYLLVPLPTI